MGPSPTTLPSLTAAADAAPGPVLADTPYPTPHERLFVLAGAEAAPLREELEKLPAASHTPPAAFVLADSMLEAVFLAAEPAGDAAVPETVIFAGVARESDQLESAIRSLCHVYPNARIYLLCDAGDEVLCRKARAWGATDYLLLPVDAPSLQRAAWGPQRRTAPVEGCLIEGAGKLPIRAIAGQQLRSPADPHALAALPLVVQTTIMNDLMGGRSNFLDRALATLQSYVPWEGALTFARAEEGDVELPDEGSADGLVARAPLLLAGQPTPGALVLTRAATAGPFGSVPAALLQAAQWLGSMLSVSQRYEQLRTMAITDELSGAFNRRYFNKFMAGLLERARANRFRVTLLLFDIDDFKKYNDAFGHASGDSIIRELIQLLRACTRPHDIVARLGGDEFAVVYWDNEAPRQPNSQHPKDVLTATERFRNAVKCHEWPRTCNIQGQISISGGLATFPWDADSLEQLMAKADQALLRAKSAGKNVILLHGSGSQEPLGDEHCQS